MPMYEWTCTKCNEKDVTIASVDDRDNPPTSVKADCAHEWRRDVGTKQAVVKGASWGNGKGNW